MRNAPGWSTARPPSADSVRPCTTCPVLQVLKNPRVVALGLAGFGIAYSTYGIVYFLPQIVKNFGLTNMQTGLVSAHTVPGRGRRHDLVWSAVRPADGTAKPLRPSRS